MLLCLGEPLISTFSLHSLISSSLGEPSCSFENCKISYICYVDKCTLSFWCLTSYSSCCTFLSRSSNIMLYSTERWQLLFFLTTKRHTLNLWLSYLNTVADDVYYAEWHSLGALGEEMLSQRFGGGCLWWMVTCVGAGDWSGRWRTVTVTGGSSASLQGD